MSCCIWKVDFSCGANWGSDGWDIMVLVSPTLSGMAYSVAEYSGVFRLGFRRHWACWITWVSMQFQSFINMFITAPVCYLLVWRFFLMILPFNISLASCLVTSTLWSCSALVLPQYLSCVLQPYSAIISGIACPCPTYMVKMYILTVMMKFLVPDKCKWSRTCLHWSQSAGGVTSGDVTYVTRWGVPETKCTRRYGATLHNF